MFSATLLPVLARCCFVEEKGHLIIFRARMWLPVCFFNSTGTLLNLLMVNVHELCLAKQAMDQSGEAEPIRNGKSRCLWCCCRSYIGGELELSFDPACSSSVQYTRHGTQTLCWSAGFLQGNALLFPTGIQNLLTSFTWTNISTAFFCWTWMGHLDSQSTSKKSRVCSSTVC